MIIFGIIFQNYNNSQKWKISIKSVDLPVDSIKYPDTFEVLLRSYIMETSQTCHNKNRIFSFQILADKWAEKSF